jgi:hypothetical protein
MDVKSLSSLPPRRLLPASSVVLILMVGGGLLAERASLRSKRPAAEVPGAEHLPATIDEARGRARWLHEALHGALQVMHRDFFDEDAAQRSLPSQSLDDVFSEMARSHSVQIRWLGVNANKGKDHLPQDRFEEEAAAALASGAEEYEAFERGRYRYVGRIRIQNECLKCHVRDRTSLEDRVGGLAFSFPLALGEGAAE